MRECKAAGCRVIINNPIPQCWRHLMRFRIWSAFTRNHQKVMLIDDQCICGSTNMSTGYSNMKYGSAVFRDLSIFLGKQELQKQRDFFRNIFLNNIIYYQDEYTADEVNRDFDAYDRLYNSKEMLMWYEQQKAHDAESSEFLQEERPDKDEITYTMGQMIKGAKKQIRIVQPYVQNVASIEDLLKEALKRGVKVEVLTARYRDQPCYMGLLNSDIFGELIDLGAVVKEEPFSFLHMKVVETDSGD